MEKGKIVALEDRIPKLKEQRRKKTNRRLIFLLLLFFAMIAIIVYTQSPLSQIKEIIIKGNDLYTREEIIQSSGLSEDTNIWKVNKAKAASNINKLSEISMAQVKTRWPNTVEILVKEHVRTAYLKQGQYYLPVMENGIVVTDKKSEQIPVNSPILFNFEEGDALDELLKGLKSLPTEIKNSISEIHYTPKKTDPYLISLFMNDGFEVSATIRTFSEKMKHYPSIISQLDPEQKGIIDLEVGSFFKAFETEVEEEESENDESEG